MATEVVFKLSNVPLSSLVFDEQYQMRADAVDHREYLAELEAQGGEWIFPPLKGCMIKGKLYVINGFTRGAAAQAYHAKNPEWPAIIPIMVGKCSAKEALILALSSNADNGFRRTNADKRKAALLAIANMEGKNATEIAAACKLSHTYIYQLIASIKKDEPTKQDVNEAAEQLDAKAKAEAAEQAIKAQEQQQEQEQTKLQQGLGKCPVCGACKWNEANDGYTCSVCLHPHGEPAGLSGDENDETLQSGAPTVAAQVANNLAVDKHAKRIQAAKSCHGQLIRAVSELGLFEKLRPQLEAISKELASIK